MHRPILFSCLVASAAAFIAQQQRPRTVLHAVDVSLEKPLGIVLEENVRDAPEGLYVAEIDADGSASACADIKVDDRLDAVNGVDTTSMGFDDVMDLIVDAPSPVRLQFSGPTCQLTVAGCVEIRLQAPHAIDATLSLTARFPHRSWARRARRLLKLKRARI